jgi:hypothetical protein
MYEGFSQKFGDKRTGSFIMTIRWHDCRPPPTLIFSVSRLKMKLKGCCFDAIKVSEAELQAALNTLTEHDFQDAF